MAGRDRKRVLFVTPYLEHPPAGGPNLRTENSIKALSGVCDLHVVSRVRRKWIGGPAAERFYAGLVKEMRYAPSVDGLSENLFLRNLQKAVRSTDTGADARFLIRYCDEHAIDVLWVNFASLSAELIAAVRKARPDLPIVCDTDSVWSRFILRELDVETGSARRREIEREGRTKEAEERAWTRHASAVTAVSEVDADYYRTLTSDPSRVHIFANALDLSTYEDARPLAGAPHPNLYLAGTFGHTTSPMDRAARFLLNEVMPRVRSRVPDVHVFLVGKDGDRTLADARGPMVTVTGRVTSTVPYLAAADIALVPLAFESGTRFKILEAGALKRPVVSTTLGAEGIPVVQGTHLLIADTADAFAEAILFLLASREAATAMGAELHALVARDYGLDVLRRQAERVLLAVSE